MSKKKKNKKKKEPQKIYPRLLINVIDEQLKDLGFITDVDNFDDSSDCSWIEIKRKKKDKYNIVISFNKAGTEITDIQVAKIKFGEVDQTVVFGKTDKDVVYKPFFIDTDEI